MPELPFDSAYHLGEPHSRAERIVLAVRSLQLVERSR